MIREAVTTHKYDRAECERLGLIAKGTITTEDKGRRKYLRRVSVEFRGKTWKCIYESSVRREAWTAQCAIPCRELGCEMIDYEIY